MGIVFWLHKNTQQFRMKKNMDNCNLFCSYELINAIFDFNLSKHLYQTSLPIVLKLAMVYFYVQIFMIPLLFIIKVR